MNALIPILTSLFFWSFVAAICITPMYVRQKRQTQAQETIRAMISQGQAVSVDTIAALQAEAQRKRMPIDLALRTSGVIVIAVGGGVLIFAVALATALWWNNLQQGASIAGAVIAGAELAIMIVGGSLIVASNHARQRLAQAD